MTDVNALDAVLDEFHAARIDALLLQIGTFPDGEAPARIADRLSVPVVVHALQNRAWSAKCRSTAYAAPT